MGEMQEMAPQERDTLGWSRWDIHALGADQTLIPSIGEVMITMDNLEPDAYQAAFGLIATRDYNEPNSENNYCVKSYDLNDELKWGRGLHKLMEVSILWFKNNLDLIPQINDSKGFNRFSCLGYAIMSLGENCMTYPGRGPYQDEETGAIAWSNDCIKYGKIFAELEMDSMPEALDWLSQWFNTLWD